MNDNRWQTCLKILSDHANAADQNAVWPEASWQALVQAGVTSWSIDHTYGGTRCNDLQALWHHEQIAAACMTTSLLLSQREAAVRRIQSSKNVEVARELLPTLASGERFATVGLAQLTTSRQHVRPVLLARERGEDFVLDGKIPWVTGAAKADHFVIGGITESGKQVLAVLPRALPGVMVEEPLDLMALQGSLTAEIRLENVVLARRWLLAGPVEQVLASGRSSPGGLETSCLALGLAGAAIDYLKQEIPARPYLRENVESLEQDRGQLRQTMNRLAQEGTTPESATALRTHANSLVLRATQAALTVSKGSGFLRAHPAQRWARQALFFLVWSCPRPATDATLALLAPPPPSECY